MLQSVCQPLSRCTMYAMLLYVSCVGTAAASAQIRHWEARKRAQTPGPVSRLKTPVEQALIPFLKTHAFSGTKASSTGQQQTFASNYVATPAFGGYVNAPTFPARTSASLAVGVFNDGVTVELGADFNKDGKTDIAILQQDGTLNILFNNGNGGLDAPVSYLNPNFMTGSINNAYAVDVNGDGYADIVAFDYNNNTTITWINLGNGTFNAAVTTLLDTTYGYPNMIYMADVNADGKADLIFGTIALQGRSNATVYLETQLGVGDGTFGTPSAAKVESFSYAASGIMPSNAGIALADINGDGKLDIAVSVDERSSQTAGTYVVETALGNGDGTFSGFGTASPIDITAVAQGILPVVAYNATILSFVDLNGDGKPDLVADVNGTLETALGNGDGTFSATPVTSDISAAQLGEQTVLLDVNGDGKLDAVVAGATLGVFLGKGDGSFAPMMTTAQYVIDPAASTQSLVVADFNNDGLSDVAQLGGDYKLVALYANTGAGGFHGAPLITAEGDPNVADSVLITAGNYTPNGYASPLLAYYGANTNDVVTMLSDGKGNFSSVKALPAFPADAEYFEPIHADFNGDGLEDIVYADTTGGIWVALAKGDGTFATPVSAGLPVSACPVYYGTAGDINGDGRADLVIPYGGDAACGSSGSGASGYYVALGKGDGTFENATFTTTGTALYKLALGDINGDGVLDLVIDDVPFIQGSGFQVSTAIGNGDGTFGTPSVVEQDYLVSDVSVADINNDGNADLVLSSEEVENNQVNTGGIIVITGNGDSTFNTPSLIATGNFFYGLQVADMNNDGNADIVATLYQTAAQPVNYYGMVTLLGYGNGQFAQPYNSLESLGSTSPIVGKFVNDDAQDVITSSGYGPALFIGQGGSALTLTTSGASIAFGTAETLTATLAPGLSGRPAATGIVSFYDGTMLLGTGMLGSGSATLTVTTLTAGTHTINAVYVGDSDFNPASSSTSTITVAALAPAFSLSGTPAAVSITGGAQGLVTLNLTANASFSGPVALTCSGMPTNGTCSISPASVTLAAGGTNTATLVIGTSGTHATLRRSGSPWEVTTAAAGSLAGLLGVFLRRKRFRFLSLLGVGLMLLVGMALTGCSGGGANKTSAPVVTPGTYTLIVTATASGSTAAAQTTSIPLTIN